MVHEWRKLMTIAKHKSRRQLKHFDLLYYILTCLLMQNLTSLDDRKKEISFYFRYSVQVLSSLRKKSIF